MSEPTGSQEEGQEHTPRFPEEYLAELRAIGLAAGLEALGVAGAEPFADTRKTLHERKAAGLAADMAFTYRNPERSTEPDRIVAGARSIVVGALRYAPPTDGSDRSADRGPLSGRVAAYATTDHYAQLRSALELVADRLREDGATARVVADDNALVDRVAAHRAGLGWFGKNSNLLAPGGGSWFVLGSVVTDAVLAPDQPVADGCGPCTRCITGCPTDAIVAPGVIDARRCLAWLVQARGPFPVEFREALGDRIYGCDECQIVCPPNRRGDTDLQDSGEQEVREQEVREQEVREQEVSLTFGDPAALKQENQVGGEDQQQEDRQQAGEYVSLADILTADDETLLARYGRWYIPDRDPRYLRRNTLVVLGNVASADDDETEALLRRHLAGDDSMVVAHAVWAARRLGREDLLEALRADPDPSAEVATELAR